MKKLYIAAGLIVVGLAVFAAYFFEGSSAHSNEVRIGVVLPLTGKSASAGEKSRNAALLAEHVLNERNPDMKAKVIVEDSQSDPKVAASAAQKLITIDGVDALMSEFTGPNNAISPIAKAAEKPFIFSGFSSDPGLNNPLAVKTFIDVEDACARYARDAKARGIQTVAMLDEAGVMKDCVRGLKQTYSDSEVTTLSLAATNGGPKPDLRTEIIKLQAQKVGAIVLVSFEPTSLAFLKQRSELGLTAEVFCNRLNCATEAIVNTLGLQAMEGVRLFDSPVNESFVTLYNKTYGETKPSDLQNAAFIYDAVLSLYEAQLACDKQDAQCIVAHVHPPTVAPSATVAATESLSGKLITPAITFYQIKGGKIVEIH